MLAVIFTETGRFPNEVLALPLGERAFIYAAMKVKNEESQRT